MTAAHTVCRRGAFPEEDIPGDAGLRTISTVFRASVTKSQVRSKLLVEATRVVVKLGTGVLTDSRKQPDLAQMEQLVAQVAEQRRAGKELVLVSSGAVGAGMGALGHERRPAISPNSRPAPPWANRA